MMTLAPYYARSNDGNDLDSDMQNTNDCRDKDETEENDARKLGEFPVQRIGEQVGTCRQIY